MHNVSSYDLLAQRIQVEIMAAIRRQPRQVHLRPDDGDDADAWGRIMSEIDENENVDITKTPEGWLESWSPIKL